MKKIMFNDRYGLMKAVLEEKKTMTRRFVNPVTPAVKEMRIVDGHVEHRYGEVWFYVQKRDQPKYKVGEVVAIAQSYNTLNESGFVAPEWLEHTCESSAGYENKMFVRADLMPHRIRITNIKVERLQDISEEDCLREGIVKTDCVAPYGFPVGNGKWKNYRTPQDAFACLIDKVSGIGTWESNPWVYAYEFELLK